MSQTTNIIFHHQLNTTSIESLARDLSVRLQVHVIYGSNGIDVKQTKSKIFNFIELGSVKMEKASETYILKRDFSNENQFIKPSNSSETHAITSAENASCLNQDSDFESFYELETESGCIIAQIYPNHLDFWKDEFLNWHNFQLDFIYNLDIEMLTYLNNWRTKNYEWLQKFDGNFMIVYSHESKSYILNEWFEKYPITKVFEKIHDDFKDKVVNISKYISAKAYENKPLKDPEIWDENLEKKRNYCFIKDIPFYLPDLLYPEIFYDDFNDLGNEKIFENHLFDFVYDGTRVLQKKAEQKAYQNSIVIEKRKKATLIDLSNYFKLKSYFVAGFKYQYNYNIKWDLEFNQEVFLVREPENKYDQKAVALFVNINLNKTNNTPEKTKIGYIGKQENEVIAKLLDNNYQLKAILSSISEKEWDKSNYDYILKITVYMENKVDSE